MVAAMLHHFLMSLLALLAIKVVVILGYTLKLHLDGTVSALEQAVKLEMEASQREGRPFSDSRVDKLTAQLKAKRP